MHDQSFRLPPSARKHPLNQSCTFELTKNPPICWDALIIFTVRASQSILCWSCRSSWRCCFCCFCCIGCDRFRGWRSWPFFSIFIRGKSLLVFRGNSFWWICNGRAWVFCILPVAMTATFTGREVRSRVLLLTISLYLKAAITAVSVWFEVARFILLALWSIRLNSLLFHKN